MGKVIFCKRGVSLREASATKLQQQFIFNFNRQWHVGKKEMRHTDDTKRRTVCSKCFGSIRTNGCRLRRKAKDGAQVPASTPTKVNMQEGQWEITTTMEMPGMPKPHTMTTTTCLTQKDPVAKIDEKNNCKMENLTTVGNTVTWKIVCPEATSRGSITYAGATYDGIMETSMKMEGKDMTSKMTMKGKYIGPCPAPAAAPVQK
jgi:hypothetical protein